jgi:rubrerythrin
MKILYLTAVVTVPSEEGQKRIDEALEKQNLSVVQEVFKDEHGHTREFYEDISAKLPNGFTEAEKEFYSKSPNSEIDENGYMNLAPEELEYEFLDYLVPLKNVIDVTDTQEIGSIIILKNGMSVHVEETVEHINFMIYMLTMSWWDKLKFRFSDFFAKK